MKILLSSSSSFSSPFPSSPPPAFSWNVRTLNLVPCTFQVGIKLLSYTSSPMRIFSHLGDNIPHPLFKDQLQLHVVLIYQLILWLAIVCITEYEILMSSTMIVKLFAFLQCFHFLHMFLCPVTPYVKIQDFKYVFIGIYLPLFFCNLFCEVYFA